MPSLREAATQALEALHEIGWSNNTRWQSDRAATVIPALRAALSEHDKRMEWYRERKANWDLQRQLVSETEERDRQRQEEALQRLTDVQQEIAAALAEPVQEPVAWSHNLIDNIISHPPADLKRHPERWTALYSEPKPCQTCVALARTVMMDQTSHDAPPQRKPLTDEEIQDCFHAARNAKLGASKDNSKHRLSVVEIARAIERAHGIGGQDD